jgi:hypothetical protein
MARQAGVSRDVLRRLMSAGVLRRVLRGVFVAAQVPDGLLVRAQAISLLVPSGAVVTDWTACWLWTGVLPFGDPLAIPAVHVFRHAGLARLRNGLCASGERTFLPEDITIVEGVEVTTPLRTALDLGRLSRRDEAIVALDALMRCGGFSRAELLGSVERFARQRGVVQLRTLAPLADPRAESGGESVLRLRWWDIGSLPRPTPQVPVYDDRRRVVYRVDLGVEEIRFGAEYDGVLHHTLDEDNRHDLKRRGVLLTRYDWTITPARKHNLFGASRDIETLLHLGIAEARRRLGRHRRPG